jgi:hypothetical protein
MLRLLSAGAGVMLVLHGLIHLMGTTVYAGWGEVEGLPYKTTLLGGRWEVGEKGMRLFGELWLIPFVGFCILGAALAFNGPVSTAALALTAATSLVLTVLDWNRAFAGAAVDAAILVALATAPRWMAVLR